MSIEDDLRDREAAAFAALMTPPSPPPSQTLRDVLVEALTDATEDGVTGLVQAIEDHALEALTEAYEIKAALDLPDEAILTLFLDRLNGRPC